MKITREPTTPLMPPPNTMRRRPKVRQNYDDDPELRRFIGTDTCTPGFAMPRQFFHPLSAPHRSLMGCGARR